MIPFILIIVAVLLLLAHLDRNRLNKRIKEKDQEIKALSFEKHSLFIVIAQMDKEACQARVKARETRVEVLRIAGLLRREEEEAQALRFKDIADAERGMAG